SSSSSRRLGISRNIVSVKQPLEDLVFSNAALHFLQPAALLELRVKLAWIHPALFGLFCDSVIKVLFGGGQAFVLGDCLDHQIAPNLALGEASELTREFVPLVLRYLIRFRVVLDELLNPAFRDVERVG